MICIVNDKKKGFICKIFRIISMIARNLLNLEIAITVNNSKYDLRS